jgi:phage-related protein (TIGR01555 family)
VSGSNVVALPPLMRPTVRHDGLMDALRGLYPYGTSAFDQPLGGTWYATDLYERDGIAQVIIDRPAQDAVARGFTIDADEAETINNELDRLNASIHLTDALRWARLYGASAILVLTRDGAALASPLNPDNLRRITDLIVFPLDCIAAEPETYFDPRQRNYGTPVRYRLHPPRGDSFVVHESRLIPFPGEPHPRQAWESRILPWSGRRALDACQADLNRYRQGLVLTMQIMERKQQAVHRMQGLTELLGTTEGQALVQEKIRLTDSVRGILNSVTIDGGPGNGVLGTGDAYDIHDLSLGGINDVLGDLRDALSASSRIPQTLLFGSDVKGLGSTGVGEQSIYHGLVDALCARGLRPAIERLAGLIWAQSEVGESEPERWRVEFGPLFSPSKAELADVQAKEAAARKAASEAVMVLVDGFLITQEEARDLARETAFPSLPEGAPPEREMLPGDEPAGDVP